MTQGRHRTESATSPRRIRAVEKQRQALQLRMAGRTLSEIAETLHYANHQGADAAIKAALRKTLQPTADEFRSLALERIEKVLQIHWPLMLQKDERSSVLVLRAIKDMRELLGLDAPVKLDVMLQEIKVEVYTVVVQGVIGLFNEANQLPDPEQRRVLFAVGMDRLVAAGFPEAGNNDNRD